MTAPLGPTVAPTRALMLDHDAVDRRGDRGVADSRAGQLGLREGLLDGRLRRRGSLRARPGALTRLTWACATSSSARAWSRSKAVVERRATAAAPAGRPGGSRRAASTCGLGPGGLARVGGGGLGAGDVRARGVHRRLCRWPWSDRPGAARAWSAPHRRRHPAAATHCGVGLQGGLRLVERRARVAERAGRAVAGSALARAFSSAFTRAWAARRLACAWAWTSALGPALRAARRASAAACAAWAASTCCSRSAWSSSTSVSPARTREPTST